MNVRHVVLDFDGTCTQVDQTAKLYLGTHRALLEQEVGAGFVAHWQDACNAVIEASPEAAWQALGGSPAAPAAADPYILAGEAVAWITRRFKENPSWGALPPIPTDVYKRAYREAEAPFRAELVEVVKKLLALGVTVTFVSNSATDTIAARLDGLFKDTELRRKIRVYGGANKYVVKELAFDRPAPPPAVAQRFHDLAAGVHVAGLVRPVYLRRGDYFHALTQVWGEAAFVPEQTLIAGDVYELDLAMPLALGTYAYLVEREPLFPTYAYERDAVLASGRGTIAKDLSDLPKRVASLLSQA